MKTMMVAALVVGSLVACETMALAGGGFGGGGGGGGFGGGGAGGAGGGGFGGGGAGGAGGGARGGGGRGGLLTAEQTTTVNDALATDSVYTNLQAKLVLAQKDAVTAALDAKATDAGVKAKVQAVADIQTQIAMERYSKGVKPVVASITADQKATLDTAPGGRGYTQAYTQLFGGGAAFGGGGRGGAGGGAGGAAGAGGGRGGRGGRGGGGGGAGGGFGGGAAPGN